jgi:outer membrane protein assembly factor BamB
MAGDDGRIYWLEGDTLQNSLVAGGTHDPRLACASADGVALWSVSLPLAAQGFCAQLAGGAVVVDLARSYGASATELYVAAYDPASGAELWTVRRAGLRLSSTVADREGRLYLAATDLQNQRSTIIVLDSAGQQLYRLHDEREGGPGLGGQLLLSPQGELICYGADMLGVLDP